MWWRSTSAAGKHMLYQVLHTLHWPKATWWSWPLCLFLKHADKNWWNTKNIVRGILYIVKHHLHTSLTWTFSGRLAADEMHLMLMATVWANSSTLLSKSTICCYCSPASCPCAMMAGPQAESPAAKGLIKGLTQTYITVHRWKQSECWPWAGECRRLQGVCDVLWCDTWQCNSKALIFY